MTYSAHYKKLSKRKLYFFEKVKEIRLENKRLAEIYTELKSPNRLELEGKIIDPKLDFTSPDGLSFIREYESFITLEMNSGQLEKKLHEEKYCSALREGELNQTKLELLWASLLSEALAGYYSEQVSRDRANYTKYSQLHDSLRNVLSTGKALEKDLKEKGYFILELLKDIYLELVAILSIPFHAAQSTRALGYLNLCRVYWTFCRLSLSVKEGLLLDRLSQVLGHSIHTDAIINTLEIPNHFFRFLSVGFFVGDFLINLALLIKHSFFPTEGEIDSSKDWLDRLKDEAWKRHTSFLNDIGWGTVNALAGYNEFFHLAAATGSWLTASFLLFDLSMFIWLRYLAQRDYLIKEAQYTAELSVLAKAIFATEEEERINEAAIAIIKEQQFENDIKWQTDNAFFKFNMVGSILIATGFSASLLLAPGMAMIFSYLACMTTMSIYLYGGTYKAYKEQQLRLEATRDAAYFEPEKDAEYSKNFNEFWFGFIKHWTLPCLFITTACLSWPAALFLATIYLSYELGVAYSKHCEESPVFAM